MAEINFQIDSTALQTIRDIDLKANFEETKTALEEIMQPYTVVVVSEDDISSAKTDRAKINKVKTNIDSYRKMVKAAYNEPYKRIEEKFKELTAICDKGIANIDGQLNAFEERRKQEKLTTMQEYFVASCKTMSDPEYVTFETALHPKWENKGTSLEECQKYMTEVLQKNDAEVKTIRNLKSEWETSLLNEYQWSHNLLSVLSLNEQLTEKAQQEAERKRKEQEERERRQAELERQREEAKKAAETASEVEVVQTGQFITEDELQKAISEDKKNGQPITVSVCIFAFKVSGTEADITAVKRFMESKGIQYEELL